IITCFARLNGWSVGIIANQPLSKAGCLDIDASDKASRFIRFCDAFNIPVVTLVDVPGYLPGTAQEWGGIIRHGAKLLYAYSEATVPKLTLEVRKAYGGAYLGMSSRDLGADFVFAWPSTELAVMGAEGAAPIIFRKELEKAAAPDKLLEEKIRLYREEFANPYRAAEHLHVDDVIEPAETRLKLITALEMALNKEEERPRKKHGIIPT
ncbi:MAG: methylmalonyl-CoA carboxyltransferase, partial [Chloroflexi bacterium]|nr:methylmalonyl-CoA carboxyltransferase [Chloroflexota bacterium]